MGRAWYAFYPGDYERDTAHLSLTEHGAYRRLMDHYYSTGSPLPTGVERLFRLCRAFADHEKAAVRTVLDEFFTLEPDGYRHGRIDAELKKAAEISEKCASAGRASAAKRQRAFNGRIDARPADVSTKDPTASQPPQPQSQPQSQTPAQDDARSASADKGSRAILSISPYPASVLEAAVASYNVVAGELGWPQAMSLSPARKSKLVQRLRECAGLDGWNAAMERARASPYLRGESRRTKGYENWVPDFDFFLQQSSFNKLQEGRYDERNHQNQPAGFDSIVAAARAVACQ